MPRFGSQSAFWLATAILIAVCGAAQTTLQPRVAASTPQKSGVAVQSLNVFAAQDGPAVEILSSAPITPSLQVVTNPLRLVIDLPGATVSLPRKRIPYPSDLIKAVRADQFQANPPVARVVVDLLAPVAYSWTGEGNRLVISMRAAQAPAKPPAVPALMPSAQPVAVPVSAGNSGAAVLAGSRLASGTTMTAGADTSILSLAHGGEVHVCPGSTVTATPAQNKRDLLLSMSTGAMETHYALGASADSILTPDFRILLSGPGEFDYAISVDSRGNTCVRTLPGNTASVIVAELMGDGTYQVKPSEHVVFRSGQINQRDSAVPLNCGCPAPRPDVMRASASAPSGTIAPESSMPATARLASPDIAGSPTPFPSGAVSGGPSRVTLSIAPPDAALPPSQPNDVHVQVEAPLVFRASDPPPAPTREVAQLSPMFLTQTPPLPVVAMPPSQKTSSSQKTENAPPQHHGFFGKLRGFFAAIFH